jgi:hypothetical protein
MSGPPGIGPGWLRIARELAEQVPAAELRAIWVFPAVRKEDREWGTAIAARRAEGDRIRIYTARYVEQVRGRERGQGRVTIEEVAACTLPVLYEVLKGVQERMAETEPPVEIAPSVWFPAP